MSTSAARTAGNTNRPDIFLDTHRRRSEKSIAGDESRSAVIEIQNGGGYTEPLKIDLKVE